MRVWMLPNIDRTFRTCHIIFIYRTPNRPNTSSRDHFWTFQTYEHQIDPMLEHSKHSEHLIEHSEHFEHLIEHSEHFEHWSNIPNISLYILYRTPNRPNTSSRDHFWAFQTYEHQIDPMLEHSEHFEYLIEHSEHFEHLIEHSKHLTIVSDS